MGDQLFAVVYKERVVKILKSGKRGKDKWVRGYRAPRPEDDNGAEIQARLAEKLVEWDAFDIVPSERFPEVCNDDRPIKYGMPLWRDLFSPRQLLCHGTSVEVFREMLDADRADGKLNEVRQAAYGYLALTLDTLLNYNSRSGIGGTQQPAEACAIPSLATTSPSSGPMPKWPLSLSGLGYDWAIKQDRQMHRGTRRAGSPQKRKGTLAACSTMPTRRNSRHHR